MRHLRRIKISRPLLLVLVLGAAASCPAARSQAAEPIAVEFDVTYLIACPDITPGDFAQANQHERLVEAAFNISSLIKRGRESDLEEFFYRIESPEKSLRIVDHLPRTQVTSSIIGHVAVEKKNEKSSSLGLGVSGVYEGVKGNASGQISRKSGVVLRYDMLPPTELLTASGTMNRERGVYFKLKPSSLTSLEGAKQFVCVFRVPKHWRGDCVRIHCQATQRKRPLFSPLRSPAVCGRSDFLVGLYAEGDEAARQTVVEVIRAEDRLLALSRKHQAELKRLGHASPLPGYAEVRSYFDTPSPRDLMARLLRKDYWDNPKMNVPPEIRRAVARLLHARLEVRALNGREGSLEPVGFDRE